MSRNQHPIPTLPTPRPSRRPGAALGAQTREAQSPPRAPVSGKARELEQLVWIDVLVVAVLVLLLVLAKASM